MHSPARISGLSLASTMKCLMKRCRYGPQLSEVAKAVFLFLLAPSRPTLSFASEKLPSLSLPALNSLACAFSWGRARRRAECNHMSGWVTSRGRTQHAVSRDPGLDDTLHSPLQDLRFLETLPACPCVPRVFLGCNLKISAQLQRSLLLHGFSASDTKAGSRLDLSFSSQTLLPTFWLHPSQEYFENKMK